TEYGRRYLRGIQSLQDFRDKHPLTKYDHYQDYFQRLAEGEKNVCVATKFDRFGTSSGTTGKGKLIPVVMKTSTVYRAFAMLEDDQDMFLEDLSVGRINPSLNLDEEIRRSLNAALKPNLARANELRAEFARGFEGIAIRIWPHLLGITTIDISGYMKKLSEKYTKGTRSYSPIYACTESVVAVNLWMDGQPQRYVLIPTEVLTEFVPEDLCAEENPETLLIDEIEVGKRYEIVLTTVSGFYRYRMGDVVEVVGFHENCPVIQIKYRTGELLNLRSEKIDKLVVNNAIQESLGNWPGVTLVEWTCAESPLMYGDQEGVQYDMYYLLFVELEAEVLLSSKQKSLFDKSLRKQHEFYDHYRTIGTICEARVMIVRPGSFKKLQEFIVANSTASYNQFKMPKKLHTKATVDLMMSSVTD
ncbi:GH3 domain-containing protein-like, partial [Acanthaster planci]|uniref:GH3 domain-containing protein-like n=1 Tax=Acanthaster planci TaxID=133434 RepID=A0A8B7ZSU4_ACAPL